MISTIVNRRDFLALNETALRYATPFFVLIAKARSNDHPIQKVPRIGYTVTKKMGNAVVRNHIKRRLREAFRHKALPFLKEHHDYVMISRQQAETCVFSELERHIEIAFSRIHASKEHHRIKKPT
ncbi:MAG: ribonuclease P protein component [Rickettsiales bacterium]|nr:ribonuclease P protein component [Rickettsiales bacterium]